MMDRDGVTDKVVKFRRCFLRGLGAGLPLLGGSLLVHVAVAQIEWIDANPASVAAAADPSLGSPATAPAVVVEVDPAVSASINGHLELDRSKYFNLATRGHKFQSTLNDPVRERYYIDTLGMSFGRELGGVVGVSLWNSKAVREDSSRPGHVDLNYLDRKLSPNNGGSSASFISKFSPNLGMATHDRNLDGWYPSFMPTWTDGGGHEYPVNVQAAAEYAVGVLEHNYTSWTRPATYEAVNEPHWSTWSDQRLADLHTAIKQRADAVGLSTDVGGPCLSVAYFYKREYDQFHLKSFIDNTRCGLDFYSFHIYDYLRWDPAITNFTGRVSTGLPSEGVLDLVENYTVNTYGKPVEIVLSEHGGYISKDKEATLDLIANTYFPGSGFDWEMKRRSVSEFLAVSSEIANTMTFLNNPHVVRKAVPFILLESFAWDPRYYSTLLVATNFNNKNVWVESTYVNFYKFFAGVRGRRIKTLVEDPDIQCQGYADGRDLHLLFNNLSELAHPLELTLSTNGLNRIQVRRFGRSPDFTPYFTEAAANSLDGITLAPREALALKLSYAADLVETQVVDEVPHYGDLIQQRFSGFRTFTIVVPEYEKAQYATLRVGVGRDAGTDRNLMVVVNGTLLNVPMEDCADRLEDDSDYGTTKLVSVPVGLLRETNRVIVRFPSGSGGIGSVVLRVALDRTSPVLETAGAVNGEFREVADATVDNVGRTITIPRPTRTSFFRLRAPRPTEILRTEIAGPNLVLTFD